MRNLKARDPRVIMCRPVQLFTASAASMRGLRHCVRKDCSLDSACGIVESISASEGASVPRWVETPVSHLVENAAGCTISRKPWCVIS